MKLTLSKETVRRLAVKSALRTGAYANPSPGGVHVNPPPDVLDTVFLCPHGYGEGGISGGEGGGGGCLPGPQFNMGDPIPVLAGGIAYSP